MTSPTTITEQAIDVANGRIKLRFRVGGDGAPLIYFHPAAGLVWDPFLTRMAEDYRIYAPEFPGTSSGDPYAIHQIDDVRDAVLAYAELVTQIVTQPATEKPNGPVQDFARSS